MADKKYNMVLSSEESKDVLKMLQKSLRNADEMIKKATLDIKKARLNTALDDEINIKRIDEFRNTLNKMKVRYSIKLRFVQNLEEKIEDDNVCISAVIKIAERDTVN